MKLTLYEAKDDPVGEYDTEAKTLRLDRDASTMLYADIDWLVVVGPFQINPLRHAPPVQEQA